MLKEIRGQVLVWIVAVALASMLVLEAKAQATSANELFSKCQAVTNPYSGAVQDTAAILERGVHVGECVGMLWAVFDLGNLVTDANTMERTLHFCAPTGVAYTSMQLAMIFENYARQHPERLSYPAAWVINEAMIKAFPCDMNRK